MAISVSGNTDIGTDPWIPFNSVQFYLYSTKTIQLSQGALQSPEPEPPWRTKAKHTHKHTHTHTHSPFFISFVQTVIFSVSVLLRQMRTDRHTHTHTFSFTLMKLIHTGQHIQ